ncbi:ATP-binding protein [Agitococcus lubricus]|uniref:histidine kinase n=1 Tax=Agitococcus lubricus TaxID=1077255 RepID=A0A2T5J0Q4_9GAMM|nr:ATP-binding protein [Agitococcus lubricus]PTQ89978.1 two-component system sensor histidine kinase BaeS [Agitococcus lubricus]
MAIKLKPSIVQTLFLVMTGVASVVVLSMAIMMSVSLEKGFKNHIRMTELSHMTAIEKALIYHYQQHGGWQFLQELDAPDFAIGMSLLVQQVPGLMGGQQGGSQGSGVGVHDLEILPNTGGQDGAGQTWQVVENDPTLLEAEPTPAATTRNDQWQPISTSESEQNPALPTPALNLPTPQTPPMPQGGRPQRGSGDLASIGQRMAVVSVEGRVLAGHPHPELDPRRELYLTENGEQKLIGYLALAKPLMAGNIQSRGDEYNNSFINQQIHNILGIAVLGLMASALAAGLLARYFRQPIKELADAAQLVAAGDFSIRINSRRRDELGDVARDFNQMAEQLEAFERSRRQWVADTSHELRTPITILSTHLEAMADGIIPTNSERLGVLAHTVADMNRLVGDLHQLASADAGKQDYQFQPVAIGELLADLQHAFSARLQQQQLSLEVSNQTPDGLCIDADRLRITQVLANLLTNSSRYTDAGGKVCMTAHIEATQLRLTIEDSAPSVPTEALAHLFDRFYRVDESRSRKNGGSGLGLAICQAIVSAHNGLIQASHSLLGGLKIDIYLPLEQAETV